MLDAVQAVGWIAESERWRAVIKSALPSELEWLSLPEHSREIINRVPCPCGLYDGEHKALSLSVSLAYHAERRILIDRPMLFCLNRRVLLWEGAEEAQRALRARPQETLSPTTTLTGVGARVSRPLFSDRLSEWFFIPNVGRSDGRVSDKTAITWRIAPACVEHDAFYLDREDNKQLTPESGGVKLPDGLCFHSNDAPPELTMVIEPTTRCNFTCGFCYGRHIEQGNLSFDDLVAMMDRLPELTAVQLVGEGEPLINTRFYDLLREVKTRGIWAHVTTNGSLLDEARAHRLFAEGLDSLAVSLESLRPERFSRIRAGGDIAIVRKNLTRMMRLKNELRAPMQVGLWVSVLRDTVDELVDMVDFKESLEMDFLEVQPLNSMVSYSRFYDEFFTQNLTAREFFAERLRSERHPEVRRLLKQLDSFARGNSRCEVFFGSLRAMWDGSVSPCCMIKTPDFPSLGDLRKENFETIWNRPRFRAFRFALQHGAVFGSCEGCSSVIRAPGSTAPAVKAIIHAIPDGPEYRLVRAIDPARAK